jgi:hypothetical protein
MVPSTDSVTTDGTRPNATTYGSGESTDDLKTRL